MLLIKLFLCHRFPCTKSKTILLLHFWFYVFLLYTLRYLILFCLYLSLLLFANTLLAIAITVTTFTSAFIFSHLAPNKQLALLFSVSISFRFWFKILPIRIMFMRFESFFLPH